MHSQITIHISKSSHDIPLISTVATGWTFTTAIDSGYQTASGKIGIPLDRAITTNIVNSSIIIVGNGRVLWEGVVTESGADEDGLNVSALGKFSIFDDKLINSFYAHEGSADWRIVSSDDVPVTRGAESYEVDNNNRIYLAPRKGELLSASTRVGAWCYEIPSGSNRPITSISFDYDIVGGGLFEGRVSAYQAGFTSWTLVLTLPSGTGPATAILPLNSAIVELSFKLISGTTIYTGETGDTYARFTNIRVMSGGVASLSSADVIGELLQEAYLLNPTINPSTSLVQQTGSLVVRSYVPQDVTVKSQLIEMGRRNRWQVTYYDCLRFCPYGALGRIWYVSADTITAQESISDLYNRGYATYKREGGDSLRTAIADDLASQALYGVKKEIVVSADTTSQSVAELHRDVAIADSAYPSPRVTITMRHDVMPNSCEIRAGDKIYVKNLPPLSRILHFIVGATSYDVDSGIMTVSALDPVATLEAMIASRD